MPDALHLVKIPVRADRLATLARRRGLRLRDLDEGYLCHCVIKELWQERAPSPFVVQPRGRFMEIWGYTTSDADALIEHARSFADPELMALLSEGSALASRPMPRFEPGRRVGFRLRACPVVRLGRGTATHRAGAEIDAFLARCLAVAADVGVSREDVYRDWLLDRLNDSERSGAQPLSVRLAGMSRERLVRRTHGPQRQARQFDRPDVHFEGELIVVNGARFADWLAHGVGRHRAFGFGALMLVPPGRQGD
jgi:CRISPR system Cascade subunit CasE